MERLLETYSSLRFLSISFISLSFFAMSSTLFDSWSFTSSSSRCIFPLSKKKLFSFPRFKQFRSAYVLWPQFDTLLARTIFKVVFWRKLSFLIFWNSPHFHRQNSQRPPSKFCAGETGKKCLIRPQGSICQNPVSWLVTEFTKTRLHFLTTKSRLSFYIIIKQAINAKLGRSHLHWDIHVLKHKNWPSKHGSRVGATEGIVIRKGRNLHFLDVVFHFFNFFVLLYYFSFHFRDFLFRLSQFKSYFLKAENSRK